MESDLSITNEEQEKVVKKLEEVVNLLKHVEIKNKESLSYISKPLDDLLSSLKYLPTEPPFSFLPAEIKIDILGYLCNSGTLVASSVCQEWKEILKPQVNEMTEVKIGKHCSNQHECEGLKCCNPEGMLRALTTLKPDIPLTICHPLTQVRGQLVTEGLTSVSSLTLVGDCADCVTDGLFRLPIFTSEQKEQLLVGLENKSDAMEMVKLRALSLTNLDQDRLVNFLIHKNGILHLDEGDYGPNLDIKKLVGKIKDSTDFELKRLVLNNVKYPDDLDEDLADALCKLPVISFEKRFRLKERFFQRLFQKLIFFPIATESILFYKKFHWSGLIEPLDLETLVDKMMAVELRGTFAAEQLEAVRTCPGVQVNSNSISKGFNI